MNSVQELPKAETQHVPAILRQPRRIRFLKLIAIFKILQGVLLLALGFSLFFLNSRTLWLEQISDWADEELLLHHSRAVLYLLNKLQDVLAEGQLRATALLAFFIPQFYLRKVSAFIFRSAGRNSSWFSRPAH